MRESFQDTVNFYFYIPLSAYFGLNFPEVNLFKERRSSSQWIEPCLLSISFLFHYDFHWAQSGAQLWALSTTFVFWWVHLAPSQHLRVNHSPLRRPLHFISIRFKACWNYSYLGFHCPASGSTAGPNSVLSLKYHNHHLVDRKQLIK